MLNKKKGQYSFEIIFLVAVTFFITIGIIFYFMGFMNSNNDEKEIKIATSTGEKIIRSVNEMYHRSGFSREIIRYEPIESLVGIDVEGGTSLVLKIETSNGEEQIYFRNDVPISNKVNREQLASGVIMIENRPNATMICPGTGCNCDEAEINGDRLDQNCDGKDGP